jgi:hypothetical protein
MFQAQRCHIWFVRPPTSVLEDVVGPEMSCAVAAPMPLDHLDSCRSAAPRVTTSTWRRPGHDVLDRVVGGLEPPGIKAACTPVVSKRQPVYDDH